MSITKKILNKFATPKWGYIFFFGGVGFVIFVWLRGIFFLTDAILVFSPFIVFLSAGSVIGSLLYKVAGWRSTHVRIILALNFMLMIFMIYTYKILLPMFYDALMFI